MKETIKVILLMLGLVFVLYLIFPKVQINPPIDPLAGTTKAPDMIENHLKVERFGRVHKTTSHPDGTRTDEEYWEAEIHDDRNHHVYFVRCTPEVEAKWNELIKELKDKNMLWRMVPLSKEDVLNKWGKE